MHVMLIVVRYPQEGYKQVENSSILLAPCSLPIFEGRTGLFATVIVRPLLLFLSPVYFFTNFMSSYSYIRIARSLPFHFLHSFIPSFPFLFFHFFYSFTFHLPWYVYVSCFFSTLSLHFTTFLFIFISSCTIFWTL